MYVDDDFWVNYGAFVVDSLPRHKDIVYSRLGVPLEIEGCLLDLGCGKIMESRLLFKYENYIGMDLNPPEYTTAEVIKDNYRLLDFSSIYEKNFPVAFSSLFSCEITSSFPDNYSFYESLFEQIPSLEFGVVSGFYYKNKLDSLVVEEPSGIVSFQTIEDPELVKSDYFTETRVYVDAPSILFGDDVVEVWKCFNRI